MKTGEAAARTLIGWQGLRFTLPPDWSVSALPAEAAAGYLKVDSPDTMFAQIRWRDASAGGGTVSLWGLLAAQARRRAVPKEPKASETLQAELETFLSKTAAAAKKGKTKFDYKLRAAEVIPDKRTEQSFSWTGDGIGHGKAWRCMECGRTVIAQVAGRPKDPVRETAAELFGEFRCHPEGNWSTWALYDLVAAIPSRFRLLKQSLLSGYLCLDFGAEAGRRILLERWGLANVTLKRFTLQEWFENRCEPRIFRAEVRKEPLNGHKGLAASGRAVGLNRLRAARAAFPADRPAVAFEAVCWHCEETNRIYALRTWLRREESALISALVQRCECH